MITNPATDEGNQWAQASTTDVLTEAKRLLTNALNATRNTQVRRCYRAQMFILDTELARRDEMAAI